MAEYSACLWRDSSTGVAFGHPYIQFHLRYEASTLTDAVLNCGRRIIDQIMHEVVVCRLYVVVCQVFQLGKRTFTVAAHSLTVTPEKTCCTRPLWREPYCAKNKFLMTFG